MVRLFARDVFLSLLQQFVFCVFKLQKPGAQHRGARHSLPADKTPAGEGRRASDALPASFAARRGCVGACR